MNQILQDVRSGAVHVAEVPVPACAPGGVLVRNHASLISAGTERMLLEFGRRTLLGKARARPDLVRQVLHKARRDGLRATMRSVVERLEEPMALGYSSSGVIVEVGEEVTDLGVGDRVACAGAGYACHAEWVFVPRNLVVRVPRTVSNEDAAYVAVGAIALHAVRLASPTLGETAAVIGLGLVGQIAAAILRAGGCRVLGVDLDPQRCALARELGADVVSGIGEEAVRSAGHLSGGQGVDLVVVAAAGESGAPIELAGEISRDQGRISVVGAVPLDLPRRIFYEKELQLRVSRSYGPGRYDAEYEEGGRDYPIGYVRWTEGRNMAEFLRLVDEGKAPVGRLTTHRFPVTVAPEAYALVSGERREPHLGILLTYETTERAAVSRRVNLVPARSRADAVGVGVIGAGRYARSVLLPRLAAEPRARLIAVATTRGASARSAAERFGAGYATTEWRQVIGDSQVEAVVIATPHDSHAMIATAALESGRHVFLEKPVAIDEEGLTKVLEAAAGGSAILMVGFNRRFSELAHALRSALADRAPLVLRYRVNAGPAPADHWAADPAMGGRIVGEACHMVDLLSFLTGDLPIDVSASAPRGSVGGTAAIHLRYGAGHMATLDYVTTGDMAYEKERIEAFGDQIVGVIEDFRTLVVSDGGRRRTVRRRPADKGHDRAVAAFFDAISRGGAHPVSLASLEATTRATFAVSESLQTGAAVSIASRPDAVAD